MKKILFLEDHKSVRQGISAFVEKLDATLKIIQASNVQEALDILGGDSQIKAVVIDLNLSAQTTSAYTGGGTNDGLFALSEFRKIVPNLNAIVYTMFSDAEHIRKCIAANVQGYVTKSSSVEELCRGIKAVASGGTYFCREAMEVLSKSKQEEKTYTQDIFRLYKKLTPKEKEIFILLAKGSSTQEIASLSGKKESTVKNQRTSIYQKLDCSDRYELSKAAQDLGLI